MKIHHLLLIFIVIILSSHNNYAQLGKTIIINEDWGSFYDEVNLDGTFILTKINSDTLHIYNDNRSEKIFLPASTFKILNSLISLETKAVENENEIIKWDGIKRFYDKWNQDQNLKTAIKYSCVWFYQELARRVGRERMQHYLDTVNYGNGKLGKDIDKFWLEGDLRISALQQIEFLTKLLNRELPFARRNMEIVENILLVDSSQTYKLYAKTGWTARVDSQIGWYVGFVKTAEDTWIFALNIDINENEDAANREGITREILKMEKLIN